MKVRYFEDLKIWKDSRELVKNIYDISKNENFSKDYGLKDQLRRAFVSIMSNIAEGYKRGRNQEFIHFLYIAEASCAEVRCQLYVAYDQGYIEMDQFDNLNNFAKKLSVMISNFIKYLKRSGMKGEKFKPEKIKSIKEELEELLKQYEEKKEE